jgi:O-antigen/teichoic acid export membrane protein
MGVVLLAATMPAATFYKDPRLVSIIPVLALGAIITGFENIGIVEFRKSLNFESEVRFLLIKQITSFAVTVPLAFAYRSYWALVIGTVAGRLFSVIASYRLHPYRPRLSLAARGDLLHFSKWLLISNLVGFLQNRSADFVLGRTIGPMGLGLYKVAFEIATMPSTELIAPVNRAVFPAYSQLTQDLPELQRHFLQVFGLIALIAFPVSIGLACVAAPTVLVVLGEQWIGAIPILQLFTIAGLASALQGNLYLMLMALGKPKVGTLVALGTLLLSLPVFVAASIEYGAVGAAWTYMVFSVIGLIIVNVVFLRTTRVRVGTYLTTLWRPLVSALGMFVVLRLVEPHITNATDSNLARLLAMVAVGAAAYGVSELALWWLSGRPPGAERIALEFALRRVRILRT